MDVYVGGEGKEGEGERGLGAQFFDGRAYLLYREHCTVLPIIRYAFPQWKLRNDQWVFKIFLTTYRENKRVQSVATLIDTSRH